MATKQKTRAELETHQEAVRELATSLEKAHEDVLTAREDLRNATGVWKDQEAKLIALALDPDEATDGPLFNPTVRTLDKLDPPVPVPAIKKLTEVEDQARAILCAGDLVNLWEDHQEGLAAYLVKEYELSEKQANVCLKAAENVADEIRGAAAAAG